MSGLIQPQKRAVSTRAGVNVQRVVATYPGREIEDRAGRLAGINPGNIWG
jgi:hypothetical protein